MIPLSALYFDEAGGLKADRWPPYATYQALVDPLLARLRVAALLQPGPEPPIKPAFKAEAVTPGARGIRIEVEIANVAPNAGDPSASTADFTIKEADTYEGVALSDLAAVLGSGGGGTRRGLVFLAGAAPNQGPKAGSYPMSAANPDDPARVDIPNEAEDATAFTLETRSGGPDAPLTTIDISDVDASNDTFTLEVTWTKTQNVAMSALPAAFAHVLNITAPDGGFRAPAGGHTVLTGGSDAVAVDPVPASAVINAQ